MGRRKQNSCLFSSVSIRSVNLPGMIHDDMRISRNFKIRDWKALHFKEEADWVQAVEITIESKHDTWNTLRPLSITQPVASRS